MAEYVNQLTVNIGEVVKLTFNDVTNVNGTEITKEVVCVAMHPEFLNAIYQVVGNTLTQHAQNMAEAVKQAN